MPIQTYKPLATVTLASSASSVTFSNIPATYRDLILVLSGSASSGTNVQIRFNGDSANNYAYVAMFGNGSTTSSFTEGGISAITQLGLTTGISNNIVQVMDYSATDKHKTALLRSNGASSFVQATAGRWASTSAITSMALAPVTGGVTFNSGTTFNLFGVIA
jgi:hypothetical protein